ncbi:MAG: deoxyguanosinetriphosphate triphosphohydrolase [Planctomycetota bacterium]|nr:deoxyguanosinetriphosphate triphosphohydrolase [Planctomycetota bacterium]
MPDIAGTLEAHVAPYAVRAALSRGRAFPDHDAGYRGLFQRDRDRIVHSSAFRRLQYKTQVFVSVVEGDYFRNRLTHTLEVTQIARTIARALALNEDLSEAIALAHDLGHTPFGHSGESALDEVMQSQGGFDHNAQGLRVVDLLEQRYPRFPGLNLTYETREGFLKNCVPAGKPGRPRAELGFAADEMSPLEIQLVGHADEIAYDTHDLDDGLVSGTLTDEQVRAVPLWRDIEAQVVKEHAGSEHDARLRRFAVVRRLIATLVGDLLAETRRRLAAHRIATLQDVRCCPEELVGFSAELSPRKAELEAFLLEGFYNNPQVKGLTTLWKERLKQLFAAYRDDPRRLPEGHRRRVESAGESLDRVICDYVAGMTDRYARKHWGTLVGTDFGF